MNDYLYYAKTAQSPERDCAGEESTPISHVPNRSKIAFWIFLDIIKRKYPKNICQQKHFNNYRIRWQNSNRTLTALSRMMKT
jgi:hypothetical protein